MLAKAAPEIPQGEQWLYEPKWDGFRCTVFWDGKDVFLQSRDLKPLGRYFPEVEAALARVLPGPMVLDGEIVIAGDNGLEFDSLQMRIHPAASRVKMLSEQIPASFVAFDLLAIGDEDLRSVPYEERRKRLEATLAKVDQPVYLTPCTADHAEAQNWFERFEGAGLDGVIAKPRKDPYQPGKRGWLKIKHLRTVDCVIGGYRWNRGEEGKSVGSLLLGLFDDDGVLHHVGHTSSFKAAEKRELVETLKPYIVDDETDDGPGFGKGRTPGAPSRWTGDREMDWVRLRPELVCEVTFDYLQGENGPGARFRHAATFQRWRTDKPPASCTFDQIETTPPFELQQIFCKK
jgi:ATP-dependent DNA ligase